MPDPSACGYPDVETTGVNPLVARQSVTGTVTLGAGAVYQDKTVTGDIVITGPNVTIRNVKLIVTNPDYGIRAFGWLHDTQGLRIEDSEFDMNGNLDGKAVAFDGYTALRVFFHNGSDCGHMGDTVTVRDSLCAVGPDANDDGWTDAGFDCHDGPHYDGFQSDGGRNLTLEHNTIRNPCGQTSTILMSTNTSGISNVTIRDNLLAGGGYTLYCNAGPDVPNETVTGNRFARTYYPRAGFWGATTGCQMADVDSGNVWDDTGVPLG
jgi:hypothetical protein